MDKPVDEAVTEEVEKRLDDIFGEEEADQQAAFLDNGPVDQNSPLRNLKGTLLSIDWEITDDIMDHFLAEIERLQEAYASAKIPVLFLQLLGSVGKYIRNQKARAHPDSIRILNSVYSSFEKVLLDPGLPETEKRKLLYSEVNRFKALKQDIARDKTGKVEAVQEEAAQEEAVPAAPTEEQPSTGTEATEVASPSPAELAGMQPHEAFAYALEEIKQVIKSEFQALRAELRLWREGR